MVSVDNAKCTGCGSCVDVCPQQAITIHDDLAMINEDLCIQCGTCAEVCPAGAIREVVPAHAILWKGGEKMPNGFGRGSGFRRGMGFGFRGSSPPWPYVGLGRGGLPRCGYFFSGAAGIPAAWPYQQPTYPFYAGVPSTPRYVPFASQMTKEEELGFLKDQAEAIKGQLDQIETKMRDLESEE